MSLRLAPNGSQRVLCAVLSCGAEVGHVQDGSLVLRPGYRRAPDGVFRMRRWRAGDVTRHYNPNDPLPAYMAGLAPCCLPVRVQCAGGRCGGVVSSADAGPLGVDARTHEGDEHHDHTVPVGRVRIIRPPGAPQRRRSGTNLPPRDA